MPCRGIPVANGHEVLRGKVSGLVVGPHPSPLRKRKRENNVCGVPQGALQTPCRGIPVANGDEKKVAHFAMQLETDTERFGLGIFFVF